MKNKTISLEDNVFDLLSNESNASALINSLVLDHFKKRSMTEGQIIEDVKIKMEEQKLREIKNKELQEIEEKGRVLIDFLKTLSAEKLADAKARIKAGEFTDLKDFAAKTIQK